MSFSAFQKTSFCWRAWLVCAYIVGSSLWSFGLFQPKWAHYVLLFFSLWLSITITSMCFLFQLYMLDSPEHSSRGICLKCHQADVLIWDLWWSCAVMVHLRQVAVMGLSMSGMVTIRSVYTRFVRINLSLNRTSYKLKRYKWLANRWLPCWISTRCRLFSFFKLFVICETYECNVP